ncbi:hypothetical protein R1sor_010367 [Riccia sorocarpa]|uniref:Uncharacterized protein n=1 Tax=Riccia sorocarpa TaxID=122646 RepID=A0ABD3HZB6_9MARC
MANVVNFLITVISFFTDPQVPTLISESSDHDIPVVVGQQYVSSKQVHLTVASHILDFNHGNFIITDDDDDTLFKLDEARVDFRKRTILLDAKDAPVVSFREKTFTLHGRYAVFRGDSGDQLFTLKDKHIRDHDEEVYEIRLDADQEPSFEVKGDFKRRNYEIIYQGMIIAAEVSAKHHFSEPGSSSPKSIIEGKRKYNVVVNPNVDQAFISTIVAIMDAVYDD